ncbi:MAG: hypothetical protein AABX30_01865 [Nanoarchaeota archaeon]
MKIISFNLTKLSAERFSNLNEKLKINTNIDIFSIKNADVAILDEKENIVEIDFNYIIDYDPKIAIIDFKGKIWASLDKKQKKQLLDGWKDKKILDEIRIPLLNFIFQKSNIRALQLEEELGLPLHLPMPRLSPNKKE